MKAFSEMDRVVIGSGSNRIEYRGDIGYLVSGSAAFHLSTTEIDNLVLALVRTSMERKGMDIGSIPEPRMMPTHVDAWDEPFPYQMEAFMPQTAFRGGNNAQGEIGLGNG